MHSNLCKNEHWLYVYENSWIGCFGLWVEFLQEAGKHSHLVQLPLTGVLGKRLRQVLGTLSSRHDWLSYFSTFLWPLSSIARNSQNCRIAQCFCKIGGNLRWVEQNRAREVDPTKSPRARQNLELGKQPGRTILGEKIFHICYLIFPYLLSDLAGRAIKSVEFIFSAGFDGAILWSRGKKAEPDINL